MKSSLEGILQGILKRLLLPPSSLGHCVMQSAAWNSIWKFSSTVSASENMPPLFKLQAQAHVVTALSSFIKKEQAFWTKTEGSQPVLKAVQGTFLAASSPAFIKGFKKYFSFVTQNTRANLNTSSRCFQLKGEAPDPLKKTLSETNYRKNRQSGSWGHTENWIRLLQFNTNNSNLLTRELDGRGWTRPPPPSVPLSAVRRVVNWLPFIQLRRSHRL